MINLDRLTQDIETMAAFGKHPNGGNRRVAMSPEDLEGRAYLIKQMKAAGLSVSIDAAGNVFGRREADVEPVAVGDTSASGEKGAPGATGAGGGASAPGSAARAAGAPPSGAPTEQPTGPNAPALLIGSHIDTVERGGKYDGVLGVFGALECIRTLNESGRKTTRPIEVVAFNDEEERFIGFLGSYALTGAISPSDLEGVADHDGVSLTETMREIGLDPHRIADAQRAPESIAAFVELHVEQGPILEREKKTIGVVQQVKGDYRWGVTIRGKTDHAGAPLAGRKDAFMAMHQVVQSMREFRDARGDEETTLTIGRIVAEPNIETAQVGYVHISIDLRSPSLAFLKSADDHLQKSLDRIASETGQSITRTPILIEDPVDFDPTIIDLIRQGAETCGYSWRYIYSGAGHDAVVLGRYVPTAMIFVPSRDGRSHCPEEYTAPEDLAAGVNVFFETVLGLATDQEAL